MLTFALSLAPAQAAFPGPNGKIAFSSFRDGNGEVYVANADGTAPQRLTADPFPDITPAFSPDASRIAFWSTRSGAGDIYVMNADGSDETNLTNNPDPEFQPAFSPDGSQITYARNTGIASEIFTMNADGSSPTNLTNNPAIDSAPAFSPDGTRIVFSRTLDVLVMNNDGTGQTALTSTAADGFPSFSPDGQRIVFISLRDGNSEVYVMDANGTNETNLTNNPASDTTPRFSPDGTKIVFSSDRDGDTELWVMNANGSSPVNVTNNAAPDSEPDWGVGSAAATDVPPEDPSDDDTAVPRTGDTPDASSPALGGSPAAASVRPPLPPAIAPTPVVAAAPDSAAASASGRGPASRAERLGPLPGEAIPAPAPARGERAAPSGDLVNDNPNRSDVAALFSRPDTLFLSAADLGRSVGIGILLLLLLSLPAKLFNKTVQQNRTEIATWFTPLRAAFAAITPGVAQRLLGLAAVSAAMGAAVHVFLDPRFPGGEGAVAFALGILIAFSVIVANQLVAARRYFRRHLPELAGGWIVYPGQIAVSVLCVVASRIGSFVPGLMFGMSGDYEPARAPSEAQRARKIGMTYTSLLVISLVAWTASTPVAHAAQDTGAGFAVLVLDTALAVIALAGMQTIVFGLVPLMFLDGDPLYRECRRRWLALWVPGVLWLSVVVINPALTHQGDHEPSVVWLVALLSLQGLVAVSLWAFFVMRGDTTRQAATAPVA